jgi:hypothetical protein
MAILDRVDGDLLSPSALTVALGWAKRGISVLAIWGINEDGRCDCGRRDCPNPGKHPIGEIFPHGHKSATTDSTKIRATFRAYPNANLAIVPGDALVIVDVDNEEGVQKFESLDLPDTATVVTGRGQHYYFTSDSPLLDRMPNWPGIDIKHGHDGYIVVPPSNHASGKQYRWRTPTRDVAKLPSGILQTSTSVHLDFSEKNRKVSEGSRNQTLTSFAGYLRYKGLSAKAIASVLETINQEICDPPLERREVRAIARSIGKYRTNHEDAFGTLADITAEKLKWLGRPYFLRRAVTVLDGNPSEGKSTFLLAIAAAVTTEQALPFIPDLQRGTVLILSAEDDPASVLKPRLLVHGADDSKIRFQKRPFTLDAPGLDLLRAEIQEHRPVLVIIDPLTAYTDSGTDLHKATDMTRFMTELDMLAREFDLAMVLVRHLRKSDSDDPLYRGLGSIAISGRGRSGLLLGRHPDDSKIRAVAKIKGNYVREGEGETILFELESQGEHAKIRWLGTAPELTAEDLLRRPPSAQGRPDNEREKAKKFLRDILEDGPTMKTNVERAAEAHAISLMTLRRAADELGIVKRKDGRQAVWELPEQNAEGE